MSHNNWTFLPHLTPHLIAEITDLVFDPLLPPEPCDLIFVFGGSHPGLWEKAAEAYNASLGKTILATGGYKPTAQRHPAWKDGSTPESRVIRRELLRLGVPASAIVCEDRSTNSLENVLFAREVYDFDPVHSILMVCKSYGAGRQRRTLQKHVRAGTKIIPFPFDTQFAGVGTLVTCDTWMNDAAVTRNVIEQAAKIYYYGRKGDLIPVEAISPDLIRLLEQVKIS